MDIMGDSGKQSKFMEGHISQKVLDEQFLVNNEKIVDSSLAINCELHNKPAVFFSQKTNKWKCFMCML